MTFVPPSVRWISFALCALLLAGCGPSDSSKEKSKRTDAESKIFADNLATAVRVLTNPTRDNADFVQQLRASMKMTDGVLVVEDPLTFGMSVLSPNSPWVIQCGAGMSVILGNAISGSSGDIDNTVKITLALSLISKDRCRELAPLIGKEIQLIQNGQ